jgi:nucleoside-diphosphate-sugar epimerase
LIETLLAGDYSVRCLVPRDADLSDVGHKNVEIVYGDILDKKSLEAAVKGVGIVLHLAAVQTAILPRTEFFRVNVEGTKNLLEACCKFSPELRKFLHLSSISAVGSCMATEVLTEDSPCFPVDYYGESKLAGEVIAGEYKNKLPITIIRPPLVYGPRDWNKSTVLRYMRMVRRGFYLTRGSEKNYFSIIYVKDLTKGILLAAESDKSTGRTYFLCNEEPTTYDEISALSAAAIRKNYRKIVIPSFILDARAFLKELYATMKNKGRMTGRRWNKVRSRHWVCDGSRAKRELGYWQDTSLADGIEKTAAWYQENGWL